jgi:TPR repeat protein
MKFQGLAIAQDIPASVAYLRLASKNGHARAKFQLAKLLEAGWNGTPDIEGAAALYVEAGLAGVPEARDSLLALRQKTPSRLGDRSAELMMKELKLIDAARP